MTVDVFLKVTRRHFPAIGIFVAVGILAATAFFLTRTPVYSATTSAYVSAGGSATVSDASAGTFLAGQKARFYKSFFTSTDVMTKVVDELNLPLSPGQLAGAISVVLPTNEVNFTVTAKGRTGLEAKQIAEAVVRTTAEFANEIERQGQAAAGPDSPPSDPIVRILPIQAPIVPSSPSYPRVIQIVPVGAFGGLLLGYAFAYWRERLDTRLRRADDVEAAAGAAVLGILPENRELAAGVGAGGSAASFGSREALRKLRTNLRFVDVDNPPRSIVVTSASMGEGKSTVAANLAWVMAESGSRVLLVDADLRRPRVATLFGIDGSVGLSQVILDRSLGSDAMVKAGPEGLWVLPAGQIPPNPSELLGSHRMASLIEEWSKEFFVVLDAPPLLPVTDGALLAHIAGGAVLVIRHGSTRVEHVARAVENLKAVEAGILGCVLNRAAGRRLDRFRYGDAEYGYGYGYGYGGAYGYGGYEAREPVGGGRAARSARSRSRLSVSRLVPKRRAPSSRAQSEEEARH